MKDDFYELISLKAQKDDWLSIHSMNDKTEKFGLSLTSDDAKKLMMVRNETLKKYQRVEFGKSILEMLMFYFCDSQYLNQDEYLKTLERLQDMFYLFKNESLDLLSDEEVLIFMKEQFETVCGGDLDYLESTCLPRFSLAIRSGYKGYEASGGKGEYSHVDEEQRWDKELFLEVLKNLFW